MSDILFCHHCYSRNFVSLIGDDEPTCHYGRLLCGDCNAFLGWIRDPDATIKEKKRKAAINKILSDHHKYISDWESGFLKSISKKQSLSPKQSKCLDKIALRCLGSVVYAEK